MVSAAARYLGLAACTPPAQHAPVHVLQGALKQLGKINATKGAKPKQSQLAARCPPFVYPLGPAQTQQPAPFSVKGRDDSKAGTLPLWPTGLQRRPLVPSGAAETRL